MQVVVESHRLKSRCWPASRGEKKKGKEILQCDVNQSSNVMITTRSSIFPQQHFKGEECNIWTFSKRKQRHQVVRF